MATQLPAGMRNNNPGNIKYVGQAGTTPSVNTDQGDPQAVYATPEEGMRAMYQLLMKKYVGGKVTPAAIIAGQGGWTPGNMQAAQNIAASMGIGVNDNIDMSNPTRAAKFMRGLMLQEHGEASNAYTDAQITNAIVGSGPRGGPVEAAGGGAGNEAAGAQVPSMYDFNTSTTVTGAPAPAAALSAAADVSTLEKNNPWSSLASGLASSVADKGGLAGAAMPEMPAISLDVPSAIPPAAPVAPISADTGTLADIFKVGAVGQAAPLVDQAGRPRKKRDYG